MPDDPFLAKLRGGGAAVDDPFLAKVRGGGDDPFLAKMRAPEASPSAQLSALREPDPGTIGNEVNSEDTVAADQRFNTALSPAEESQFQTWKAKYAPKDSGYDYDLRGAFKAGLTPDPASGHWPDTFKKPNHETFSDESQYAKFDRGRAGTWKGEEYQPGPFSGSVATGQATGAPPVARAPAPAFPATSPKQSTTAGPPRQDFGLGAAKDREVMNSIPIQAAKEYAGHLWDTTVKPPLETMKRWFTDPGVQREKQAAFEEAQIGRAQERLPQINVMPAEIASAMGLPLARNPLTGRMEGPRASQPADVQPAALPAPGASWGSQVARNVGEVPGVAFGVQPEVLAMNAAFAAPAAAVDQSRAEGVDPGVVGDVLEAPQKGTEAVFGTARKFGARAAQGAVEAVNRPTMEDVTSSSEYRRPLEERGVGPAAGGVAELAAGVPIFGAAEKFLRKTPSARTIGRGKLPPDISKPPAFDIPEAKAEMPKPPVPVVASATPAPSDKPIPPAELAALGDEAWQGVQPAPSPAKPAEAPPSPSAFERRMQRGPQPRSSLDEANPTGDLATDIPAMRASKLWDDPNYAPYGRDPKTGKRLTSDPHALDEAAWRAANEPEFAEPRFGEADPYPEATKKLVIKEAEEAAAPPSPPPASGRAPAAPSAPDVPAVPPTFEAPPETPKPFGRPGERGAIGEGGGPMGRSGGTSSGGPPDVPPMPEDIVNAKNEVKQRIKFGEETKPKIGERVADIGKKFYDRVLRKEGAIGRLERDLTGTISDTGATRLAQRGQGGAAGRAQEFYESGNLETYPQQKAVVKALDEVKSGDLSDVSAYSVAKRVETGYIPRRFAHGFNPNATGKLVNYYENTPAHADIVRAADAIHAHYDTLLRNLAEADGWAPERVAKIREANPFYIRFLRRLGEDTPAGAVSGGDRIIGGAKIQRVKGGAQPISDPIPLIADDTRRMVQAADNARTKRAVLDMVRKNPEKAQGVAEVLTPKELRESFPEFNDIARAMEKPDVTEAGAARGLNAIDPELWAEVHDVYDAAMKKHVLFDTAGGKVTAYKITDPLLAEALGAGAPGADFLMNMWPTKVAGKITSVQRAGITSLSPRFVLRNPIRDFQTYLQYTDAPAWKVPYRVVQGLVESFKEQAHAYAPRLVPESKWTNVYKRAGVEGFFSVDKGQVIADLDWLQARGLAAKMDYFRKRPTQIIGKPVSKLIDIVRDANQTTEGMFRYAEMIETAQRRGITPDKFTHEDLVAMGTKASDITLNFRLGGEYAKVANRYEAFLNAQMQGLVRYGSEWKAKPGRMAARTLIYSVAPKVALWAYIQSQKDLKEAYDRMPAWRRLLWNLPYKDKDGNARFLSLPGPAEMLAPANVVEMALNGMVADDPEAAKAMFGELAKSIAPGGGMMAGPSVMRPGIEVHQNKSEFTGRPINPIGTEAQAEEAPDTIATPSTTDSAKWISTKLSSLGVKFTPPEIDHLIRGYAGSVGREVTSAAGAVESADTPFVGSFFPRASESRWVDDFYALKKKLEGRGAAFRSLAATGSPRADSFADSWKTPKQITRLADALSALREESIAAKDEATRTKNAKIADELAKAGTEIIREMLGERLTPRRIGTGK